MLTFASFSFTLTSMEQPVTRKRRSELENLIEKETTVDKFLCEYGCGYVGTYKTVQGHERTAHGIYKTKKLATEQPVVTAYDTTELPVETKPTMQPSTPEKKCEHIPDQPYRVKPFDRHALSSEDSRTLTLAPFIMIQTYYERNAQKKKAALEKYEKEKAEYSAQTSWTCKECSKAFEKKNRYISHLIMYHNYQFPNYKINEANVLRYMTVSNASSLSK